MAINIPPGQQGNKKPSLDEIYAMIDEFIFGVQDGKYDTLYDYDDIDDSAITIMEEYRLYTYKAPDSKITSYIDLTSRAHAMMQAGGMKNYVMLLNKKDEPLPSIYVGGNFTGNMLTQSSARDLTSPITQTTSSTNASAPPKRSKMEILYWASGILLALITLYECWFKHSK